MKILIALIAVAQIAWAESALEGGETRNGGDAIALDFATHGKILLHYLSDQNLQKKFPEIPFDKLAEKIKTAQVFSEPELILQTDRGPKEVDAVNEPKKNAITISQKSWDRLKTKENLALRYALVMHEYLSLLEIEQSLLYPLSSRFVGEILNKENQAYKIKCRFEKKDKGSWINLSILGSDFIEESFLNGDGRPQVFSQGGNHYFSIEFSGRADRAKLKVQMAETDVINGLPIFEGIVDLTKGAQWIFKQKEILKLSCQGTSLANQGAK